MASTEQPMATPQEGDRPQEHVLGSEWSLWWDKQPTQRLNSKAFEKNLRLLGSFSTVETFYQYYSHLKKPANIDMGINYFCFRHKQAPKWESFPHGGCWTVRLDPKNHTHVNQQWELLIFSLLGELLPEAVVGVVCSQRKHGCLLSVWHQACSQDERFHIGERFRDALQMPLEVVLQYKSFDETIRDGHSHRNAIGYVYVPSGSAQDQAHDDHDNEEQDQHHHHHQQQQQQQTPKSPKGNKTQTRPSQPQQQQQQQQQAHNQHHLQQRPRQKSISS